MKAHDVIGRKIVRIVEESFPHSVFRRSVQFIELDNGVRLYPMTLEGEGDYGHRLVVNRTAKINKKENH